MQNWQWVRAGGKYHKEPHDKKICGKCQRVLDLDGFGLNNAGRKGRSSYCTQCKKAYEKARYVPRVKPVKPVIPPTEKQERIFARKIGLRWCKECQEYSSVDNFSNGVGVTLCREHDRKRWSKTGMTRAEYAAFRTAKAAPLREAKAAAKAAAKAEKAALRFEKQQEAALRKAWHEAKLIFFKGAADEIKRAARDRANARKIEKNMIAAGCSTTEEYEEWKRQQNVLRYDAMFPDREGRKKRQNQWKNTKRRLQGKFKKEKVPHTWFDEQLERQGGECPYCGDDIGGGYHVDHMLPLSRGGTNHISNLQLLCSRCNESKNDKTHLEYIEILYKTKFYPNFSFSHHIFLSGDAH